MTEQLNLMVNWSSREESAQECAIRTLECLRDLAACDDVFAKPWYKCDRSLEQALTNRVDLTIESLRDLFLQGRAHRDTDRSVVEELGFSLGRLWNGMRTEAAHVSIHCGGYIDSRRMPGVNYVILEIPFKGLAAEQCLSVEKLSSLMIAVVKNWDPDAGRISTFEMDMEIYPQPRYQGQKAGWLTYISDRYGPLPKLPKICEVMRVEELGSLIDITAIDRLTSSNSAHVEAVHRLSDVLNTAGLLEPVPPQVAA